MLGIYIHIPFCGQKCPYCDFYSVPFTGDLADSYATTLCREIKSAAGIGRPADTIYIGGGTPTIFGAGRITRILTCIRENFSIAADAEITIEANPASCTMSDLYILREAGINRISFGVQSLCDLELQALGRPHTADDALRTIEDARTVGFSNISADLMLATPSQTFMGLKSSIDALAALPISHISA